MIQLLFVTRWIRHTPRTIHSGWKRIICRIAGAASTINLAHGHGIAASSATVTDVQVLLAGPGVASVLTRLQPIPTSSCTAGHDPVLELAVLQKQNWRVGLQHVLPHYGSRPLIVETALLLSWENARLSVGASGLVTQRFQFAVARILSPLECGNHLIQIRNTLVQHSLLDIPRRDLVPDISDILPHRCFQFPNLCRQLLSAMVAPFFFASYCGQVQMCTDSAPPLPRTGPTSTCRLAEGSLQHTAVMPADRQIHCCVLAAGFPIYCHRARCASSCLPRIGRNSKVSHFQHRCEEAITYHLSIDA